jgi:hypothetical protein
MTQDLQQLMFEILKRLQADVAEIKQGQRGIREEIIGVRQQLHAIQGDGLRQEQTIAGILVDLDRIKSRLELADA